jgi:hypothetical protein
VWRKTAANLKVELSWCEATRHSFVSRNLDAGVPLDEVSAAVGHSSPVVTMRFYNRYVRRSFHPRSCVGVAVHQYLQPNQRAVLEQALRVLIWGGRETLRLTFLLSGEGLQLRHRRAAVAATIARLRPVLSANASETAAPPWSLESRASKDPRLMRGAEVASIGRETVVSEKAKRRVFTAEYNALIEASSLPSRAVVRRLVKVTLAGLRPPP